MEITLNELLDRALVVPYDDETVVRLDEICGGFVENDVFNDDTVADLMIIILTHTQSNALKTKLEQLYKEKYGEDFDIPRSVCETLAIFILMRAMEVDDLTYKLALLNMMIIQNEQLDNLPFPEFFAEALQNAIKEVEKASKMEEEDDSSFVNELFSEKTDSSLIIGEDDKPIIKRIARDAWYFKTMEYINGKQLKNLLTYSKVYRALVHIVDSMPWIYYNELPMKQIEEIVPNVNTKAKTIVEIVDIVRPLYDTKKKISCKSSVLLHLIADDNEALNILPFVKTRLTVRQFAVWLYYELLLEKNFD